MKDDIRAGSREWATNMWKRIYTLLGKLDERVTALEEAVEGVGMNGIEDASINRNDDQPDA